MITAREAKIEKLRRMASRDLLAFYQYCWWMPSELKIGRHTRALCRRLTQAVEDFLNGKNTYLVVNMPFRHGKSDIVSRALPAYFIGRCAAREPNVLMSGYGSTLVKGFSAKVRDIVQSEAYRQVFPSIVIDPEKSASDEWKVKGSQSTVYAQGLGGSITGKGGNLIIVDDYCKNRQEAESLTVRNTMFDSFKDDFCSRTNAPAHIIIVCATRWHEDDIVGRIRKRMDEDPDYTRWEFLVFPARKQGPGGWDTLFPELYDAAWYDFQRKSLGPYSAAALLDCDPKNAGECYFRPEWLQVYLGTVDASQMKLAIFVDGAKGKKASNDWTTMIVIGKTRDGSMYLLDGLHERLNLAEKLDRLGNPDPRKGLVAKWGGRARVKFVWWEQVGPMSDVEALRMYQTQNMYHFTVRELHHNTNKDFRIKRLAVPLSAGDLHVPTNLVKTRTERQGENEPDRVVAYDFMAEFKAEYNGYTGNCEDMEHDDIIDCLADLTDDEVVKSFTPPEASEGGAEYASSSQWNSGKRFR